MKQMSRPSNRCLHVHPINSGGEMQPWNAASQRSKRVNSDMSDVTIDNGPDPSAAERKGRGFYKYEKRRTSDKRGSVERISDGLLHVSAHTRRIQDSRAWVKTRHRAERHLGVQPQFIGLIICIARPCQGSWSYRGTGDTAFPWRA